MIPVKNRIRTIAISGVFAALVFIGTELRIPTAIGYINLGDAVILISSFLIGPLAAFPAAIGSALGDLVAGYPVYIFPTFIIKGLMGLTAGFVLKSDGEKKINLIRRILAGLAAEIIMVAGYFGAEVILYGISAAAGSVPFNLVQGFVAIAVSLPLSYTLLPRLKKLAAIK